MEEATPWEIFWKIVVSFFLTIIGIFGLVVIFWDLSNLLGVLGGSLLFLGSVLGIGRYLPHVVLFKNSGGLAYWLKLKLDRLGSGTARVLSAALVGGVVALLWKPLFWLIPKLIFRFMPEAPDILFSLLAAFSNILFGLMAGGLAGWEYYKTRKAGSHLKLE